MTKQTIDEFLEEATIGQLKELASHPTSHYVMPGFPHPATEEAHPGKTTSLYGCVDPKASICTQKSPTGFPMGLLL